MTPPPTSIDGTDITGATIDGQEVQEITVDGVTVFSATQLPVAYQNLVAWYPFDSAEYGGDNPDDVTAILGGSGDDTAYNGIESFLAYGSSSGATDINAGANSGAYIYDNGPDDRIEIPNLANSSVLNADFTITFWTDNDKTTDAAFFNNDATGDVNNQIEISVGSFDSPSGEFQFFIRDSSGNDLSIATNGVTVDGNLHHYSFVKEGNTVSDLSVFEDGNAVSTSIVRESSNFSGIGPSPDNIQLGNRAQTAQPINGVLDDVRVYNKALTNTDVNAIYNNTDT